MSGRKASLLRAAHRAAWETRTADARALSDEACQPIYSLHDQAEGGRRAGAESGATSSAEELGLSEPFVKLDSESCAWLPDALLRQVVTAALLRAEMDVFVALLDESPESAARANDSLNVALRAAHAWLHAASSTAKLLGNGSEESAGRSKPKGVASQGKKAKRRSGVVPEGKRSSGLDENDGYDGGWALSPRLEAGGELLGSCHYKLPLQGDFSGAGSSGLGMGLKRGWSPWRDTGGGALDVHDARLAKVLLKRSQLVARVIAAEATLLIAAIHFRRISLMKGAYNLRSAWKQYEACFAKLKRNFARDGSRAESFAAARASSTDSLSVDHLHAYDQDAASALQFSMGVFFFFVSLVPAKFLWVVEAIGFQANRDRGIALLETCFKNGGSRSPLAHLLLVWINRFFLKDLPQTSALLAKSSELYPRGALFRYLAGYTHRHLGNMDEAISCFQDVQTWAGGSTSDGGDAAVQNAQLALTGTYELGWCYYLQLNWKAAVHQFEHFLEQQRAPSFRAYCGYQLGVCYLQLNRPQDALLVFEKVPGWVRKNFSFDTFAARKATAYAAQLRAGLGNNDGVKGNHVSIRSLEMSLLSADICTEAKQFERALKILDEAAPEVQRPGKGRAPEGNSSSIATLPGWIYFVYLYERGVVLRKLADPSDPKAFDEAKDCLEQVTLASEVVGDEKYVIPHALCELAEIHYEIDRDKRRALNEIAAAKKFSDFDFDKPLTRRLENLKDQIAKHPNGPPAEQPFSMTQPAESSSDSSASSVESSSESDAEFESAASDFSGEEGTEQIGQLLRESAARTMRNLSVSNDDFSLERLVEIAQEENDSHSSEDESLSDSELNLDDDQIADPLALCDLDDLLEACNGRHAARNFEHWAKQKRRWLHNIDTVIQLARLPEKSGGLGIKERRYMLKTYPKCFVGSAFVDWLLQSRFDEGAKDAPLVTSFRRKATSDSVEGSGDNTVDESAKSTGVTESIQQTMREHKRSFFLEIDTSVLGYSQARVSFALNRSACKKDWALQPEPEVSGGENLTWASVGQKSTHGTVEYEVRMTPPAATSGPLLTVSWSVDLLGRRKATAILSKSPEFPFAIRRIGKPIVERKPLHEHVRARFEFCKVESVFAQSETSGDETDDAFADSQRSDTDGYDNRSRQLAAICNSREEAVELGQRMLEEHLIHHVAASEPFRDGKFFYRFQDDVVSAALNTFRIWALPVRPAAIVAHELNRRVFDLFNEFLKDGTNLDLPALQQSREFRHFQLATAELQRIDLFALSRKQKLCFFLNCYNMLMVHGNAIYGVLSDSVTAPLARKAFFDKCQYVIDGHAYSLNDIEHGILRGNAPSPGQFLVQSRPISVSGGDSRMFHVFSKPDPRIHFALNCGAKSCPPLRLFRPESIDGELDWAAESFIEDDVEVDVKARTIRVSKIFDWYASDFGETRGTLSFLAKYSTVVASLVERASTIESTQKEGNVASNVQAGIDLVSRSYKLKFKKYDWTSIMTLPRARSGSAKKEGYAV